VCVCLYMDAAAAKVTTSVGSRSLALHHPRRRRRPTTTTFDLQKVSRPPHPLTLPRPANQEKTPPSNLTPPQRDKASSASFWNSLHRPRPSSQPASQLPGGLFLPSLPLLPPSTCQQTIVIAHRKPRFNLLQTTHHPRQACERQRRAYLFPEPPHPTAERCESRTSPAAITPLDFLARTK
jgi:hypothetical protein